MERVLDLISYRGPDGRGVWSNPHVLLGHRRLSIVDLSPAGAQPFHDPMHKLHIVFNGEVYNYKELRKEFEARGERFCSQTDTEVILACYRRWGPDFITHLRGMFAFLLYDEQHQELILARDRLGKKPLYYWIDDRKLILASETKAFHAFENLPLELELQAVRSYFAFQYIPGADSIFRGVRRLPPGHLLRLNIATWEPKETAYWSIGHKPHITESAEQATRKLDEVLEASVGYRLIADVEVGVLLSGGIDSSLIACYALQRNVSLRAFTVAFGDQKLDESPYAEAVAHALGMNLLKIDGGTIDADTFLKVVFHADEPLGDYACVPTFLIARALSRYVKVVLSGEGADELFWGYPHYQRELLWRLLFPGHLHLRPAALRRFLARLEDSPSCPALFSRLAKVLTSSADIGAARWSRVFGDDSLALLMNEREALRQPVCNGTGSMSQIFAHLAEVGGDRLWASLSVDMLSWLPNDLLIKLDRMTMAHSVEARAPFLDHEVVEIALGMNSDLKANLFRTKTVLRRLLATKLPEQIRNSIVSRPKHGFEAPFESWLRNELRELAEDCFSSRNLREVGCLRAAFVRSLWERFCRGRSPKSFSRKIWLLLCFLCWDNLRRKNFGLSVSQGHGVTANAGR